MPSIRISKLYYFLFVAVVLAYCVFKKLSIFSSLAAATRSSGAFSSTSFFSADSPPPSVKPPTAPVTLLTAAVAVPAAVVARSLACCRYDGAAGSRGAGRVAETSFGA